MILMDCHTHTQFSVDSEADIHLCVKRAAELGLAAYAITDHCECNGWYKEEHYPEEERYLRESFDYAADFEGSVSAVTALKEKWGENRGIAFESITINSVTIPEEDAERIKNVQFAAVNRDPNMANATIISATADAMRDAANNANGAATGFMNVNMAQNTANGLLQNAGNANQQPSAGGYCPQCGAPLPAGAKFCPNCGKQLQ